MTRTRRTAWIPSTPGALRAAALTLFATAALLASIGCDRSSMQGRVQVGLQNATDEPANLWVGHAAEPPGGSRVEPRDSTFAWVEVYVSAQKTGEGVYAKSIGDCTGGVFHCVFNDRLRVNVAQGGSTRTETLSLSGDYQDKVYVTWDGQNLRLSMSPGK